MSGMKQVEWTTFEGRAIPVSIMEITEQAYRSGQPYMDNLVAVLMSRGANTPAMNAEWLRIGLLQESRENPMLTDTERERIWRQYEVPWWRRWRYRFERWQRVRRLMKTRVTTRKLGV